MTKDEATAKLLSLKAVCREACDDPSAAVAALDPDSAFKASVAHHVQRHGDDAVGVGLGHGKALVGDRETVGEAGRGIQAFVEPRFIAEVSRVSLAAARGEDPVAASGADPAHVALLEAARVAHADHGDELGQAYADFAAAG